MYGQFKALEGKTRWYNALLNNVTDTLGLLNLMVVSINGFQASDGTVLNADVNACYNIIQKAFPKAHWVDGMERK